MGAMERTLLGLLFLLLAPAGAPQEGEVCLVWLHDPIKGLLLFRCPQHPNGTDGRFCCGSCLAPYCCDSEVARLDQDQYLCLNAWKMLKVFVDAAVAQKEGAAVSVWQDLQTTTPTPRPRPKIVPTDVVLGLVAIVLIAALLTLVCFWKRCPELCTPFLGRCLTGNDAPPDFPMVVRPDPWPLDPRSPRPRLEIFDLPPPYQEIPPLPPYSQVAPSNHSHGATAGPGRPALSGGGSEVAATQSPTTSGASSINGPTDEPADTGDVTPELGAAAAAGEVTPVQDAAGGGNVILPAEERVLPM